MAAKVPSASVLTNSAAPPTQTAPSTVTSVPSTVYNNNNGKMSGVATSIITAPLMTQAQSSNSMQKQAANNVPVTTTTASSSIPATGARAPSSAPPPLSSGQTTSTGKSNVNVSGTTAPGSVAVTDSKAGGAAVANLNLQSANSGAASGNNSSAGSKSAAESAPTAPPPKPTDFNNKSVMNGGATAVMKQPPPPVTVLPPTPAATPPPVHKHPPAIPPVTATNTPSSTSTNNNNTTNQKSQPGEAPPSSSANSNTPAKQSPSTPRTIEKIENQEAKPTQPLPVQQQGISASSATYKQGVQQEAIRSGNQDQKVINSATSSVTDPTNLKNTSGANASTVSSTSTISSKPTAIPSSGNSNNTPSVQQSVASAIPTNSVVNSSAPITKTAAAPTAATVKKMESAEAISDAKGRFAPGPNSGAGDASSLLTGADATKKDSGAAGTEKSDISSKVDLILTKTNDINKSIYIPTTNEQPIIGKSEKSIGMQQNKKNDEGIGEDVQRIVEVIENSGLCDPKVPEQGYENGSESKVGEKGNKASKINRVSSNSNRPAASDATRNRSLSRPGTATSPLKGSNVTSPTKSRPSTASARKDHSGANGVSGIPTLSSAKNQKEKAAPASGTSNGSPASLPPKSGTSGPRTSTSHVASAKVNTTTTPTTTAKAPNEINSTKTKANGADSSSASPVETETGLSSAAGSKSTPRLRPSSSLYRPTASSALKGVSSAPHSSTSNHNLPSSPSTPRTSRSSAGARRSKSATTTMGDSAGGSGEGKPATLREQFTAFSRFGNKDEDGKHITLSNCDKWMKQAKVIDGKKVTTTDTSICFKKLFKTAKKITFEDFKKYVEELAKSKKVEPQEILDKLTNSGPPGLSSATKAAHSNVVDRLTDTSKYTGSHKERFDSTGKGRGIEGRKDVSDGSGYVAAFKDKLDLKDADGPSASPPPPK